MLTDDQKPIQGWKAASIMLGVAGLLLLATWAMNSSDKSHSVAMTHNADRTVGAAPQRESEAPVKK